MCLPTTQLRQGKHHPLPPRKPPHRHPPSPDPDALATAHIRSPAHDPTLARRAPPPPTSKTAPPSPSSLRLRPRYTGHDPDPILYPRPISGEARTTTSHLENRPTLALFPQSPTQMPYPRQPKSKGAAFRRARESSSVNYSTTQPFAIDVDRIVIAKVASCPSLLSNLSLPVVKPIIRSNFRASQDVRSGSGVGDLKNTPTPLEKRSRDDANVSDNEATYEVLPRLNEIKFGSGVIDELLFVDLPRERRFANGIMMLEYGKAVQESVYEQFRVVREGQLRIIFTQELKILSWEFCARRHEELLPRRLVTPQVNQLLQVAHKCQTTLADSGSEGVSSQDLQTNSNMVVTAGRQLAKSLELQSLNDLGFSKRYVRCLQIAEVVNSMKDHIDFCRDNKVGPIEGLKSYPRHASTSNLQMQRMQEMEQLASIQGLPTDRNTINKLMAMQPGVNNHDMGNNHNMIANNRGALSGPAAAALALTNYQNITMRQNSINSNPNSLQQEAYSLNNSNQSPSSSFQGASGLLPGLLQNHQPSQGSHALQQQHMIQQMLQDLSGNNAAGQQKAQQNASAIATVSGLGYGNNSTPATPTQSSNVSGGGGLNLSKSNSFKAASNSDSSAAFDGANGGFNQKAPDLARSLHSHDDMVPNLPHDFGENGFFWE